MLTTEPDGSGTQATLRVSGILRFLPAGFLAVWLCGWAVGEWFALRLCAAMVRTLLGRGFLERWLPALHGTPPSGPMLVFFAAFLTLWLALWTLGGVGAFYQLLTLLCGRDVVRWGGDALEIRRSALWFTSWERVEARAITGFRSAGKCLVADTRQRAVRLTAHGSVEDRAQLAAVLEAWRASIAPPEPLAADESPIASFVAFRDETGALALMRPRAPRRSTGVLLAVLGLALFGGVVSIFAQKSGAALVVGVLFLLLAGAACLAGSVWLLASRETWHIGPGRLERRRRLFARTWTAEFVPLELQLSSERDSDGDLRWALVASGAGRRHTLASALEDPNPPLTLGTWLAARTGARFVRRDFEGTLRRAG